MLTRLLSLGFFLLLAAGLYLIPDADPNRLAAVQIGTLLDEPAEPVLAADEDWRDRLQPGDEVRTADDTGVVVALEPNGVRIEGQDGTQRSLAREALVERTAAATLWRTLVEPGDGPPTIRLGGMRMAAEQGLVEDVGLHGEARRSVLRRLRAIAGEEGLEFEVEGATKPLKDGLDLKATRTLDGLRLEVARPGGGTRAASADWSPPRQDSLYPPLLAILLAILFRRPVLALFMGVLCGTYLMAFYGGASPGGSAVEGLQALLGDYLVAELVDTDRQLIIAFVVFMLAMVGVMTRSGGIRGLMDRIARLARSVKHTQVATWLMGLAVFFDDYANTILVGSTMRPLSDRYKIAREKLAYIVDSTAAPVAGLSIFSTWIAFEVSTFSAQLPDAGYAVQEGYSIFIETLPYRFYCIFTLIFVGLIVLSGRDFGPMLAAERRARRGQLIREGGTPLVGEHATSLEPSERVRPAAARALLPILTFIGVTLVWMAWKGGAFSGELDLLTLRDLATVLGDGDVFRALMVGSAAGYALACLLGFGAGLRGEIASASWASLRSMGIAILILYLAWMIGAVCGDMGTANYLTVLVGDALNPLLLPVILFLLSGIVAFSTGSSWSTMTILLPIVVGLAHGLGEQIPIGGHVLMILSIGAVLEGAIFGDHCSPISDTTVMSSIACASDHIDHVRTQSPYAVMTMGFAMLFGYFPCTFLGWSPLISLGLGVAAMVFVLWKFGGTSPPEFETSPGLEPAAAGAAGASAPAAGTTDAAGAEGRDATREGEA